MTPGKEGDGMHRTDSVDFVVILDGEINVGIPAKMVKSMKWHSGQESFRAERDIPWLA